MATKKSAKRKPVKPVAGKGLTVKAYRGDNKTLLAFNFADPAAATNLAGFTICCNPPAPAPSYFLFNMLQFETPGNHAQIATEPANSSANAPIEKFRWVHFPGSFHQGLQPAVGLYTYVVTLRYFDAKQSMLPMDPTLNASATIEVGPFTKNGLSLGFTRGYMQSQAFTHHVGLTALVKPKGKDLIFDTSAIAGTDAKGTTHTFQEEYEWMGFTARAKVFEVLNEVLNDGTLQLDMFAYDLDEPDIVTLLLAIAKVGRIRIVLDNATLHHAADGSASEDQFEVLFNQAVLKKADPTQFGMVRGKFSRFSHDKVLIVAKYTKTGKTAQKVLTGSTNFSVNGLYVNANHVLVFDDPAVAAVYEQVFQLSFESQTSTPKFLASPLSSATPVLLQSNSTPKTQITFSPHTQADADTVLGNLTARINAEAAKTTKGSVLFAVMQLTGSPSSVYSTLAGIHTNESIFTYGISDSPGGVTLMAPGKETGVLVTGKTGKTVLPPPFDQVPVPPGHEIHDKFVVCGFNGDDPVVYCGSSNLASGGEMQNGDNLLAIHDGEVATAFAIEALLLVDHYSFLDRFQVAKAAAAAQAGTPAPAASLQKQPQSKQQAAVTAKMFLFTNDIWAKRYYDPNDLRFMERELFA